MLSPTLNHKAVAEIVFFAKSRAHFNSREIASDQHSLIFIAEEKNLHFVSAPSTIATYILKQCNLVKE